MNPFVKANRILAGVGVLFLVCLAVKLAYPQSLAARCMLFAAEAALVGGIADWFAVTALFRKPLGIPWHTAILPRRREAFTKATIQLAQEQFFSRKNIFNHLKQ